MVSEDEGEHWTGCHHAMIRAFRLGLQVATEGFGILQDYSATKCCVRRRTTIPLLRIKFSTFPEAEVEGDQPRLPRGVLSRSDHVGLPEPWM